MTRFTKKKAPKQALIADSTQIVNFLDCERLHRYRDIMRLVKSDEDSKARLAGTIGHKYLELYYKYLSTHPNKSQAIDYAFETAKTTSDFAETVQNLNDTELHSLIKEKVRMYSFIHSREDITIPSPDHVEVGFSEKIYEDDWTLFILEGRLDLIGSLSGVKCVMDHKFQFKRRDLWKKMVQFRNYAMASKVTMLIVNYIRLTKKSDASTYVRDIASFVAGEHDWWKGELIKIFKRMLAARQFNVYNPNWGMCSGKFGYPCNYTDICQHVNPHLQQNAIDTLYQVKPIWTPWD